MTGMATTFTSPTLASEPAVPTAVARTTSRSSGSIHKEKVVDPETQVTKDLSSESYLGEDAEEAPSTLSTLYAKTRPLVLVALALAILGWWISATILKATRHRW